MDNKVIVMDLDGTLLNSNKEISEKTKAKLILLQQKGIRLILASGRSKSRIEEYALDLHMDRYGGFIIEANGAGFYEYATDSFTLIRRMKLEESIEIFTFLKQHFPNVEIAIMAEVNAYSCLPKTRNESIYFNKSNMESMRNRKIIQFAHPREITETINKVCICDTEVVIDQIYEALHQLRERYWYGRTLPTWIEIGPKEVSKGSALMKICEKINVSLEQVLAFGDGENDLSMLTIANGVAMKNATSFVKQHCLYQTLSCDDDGIVYFLQTLGY